MTKSIFASSGAAAATLAGGVGCESSFFFFWALATLAQVRLKTRRRKKPAQRVSHALRFAAGYSLRDALLGKLRPKSPSENENAKDEEIKDCNEDSAV